MTEQSESKYARKFKSGKMMYGPGCGANKRTHVEINTKTREGGKLVVANTPAKYLPVFTDQKTARPVSK